VAPWRSPRQQRRAWHCCGITGAGTDIPRGLTWDPGPGQGEGRSGSDSLALLEFSNFQIIFPEPPDLPENLGAKA